MKQFIGRAVILSLFVSIVVIAIQFALALVFVLILGQKFNQTIWVAVYQALVYAVSLFVIIFLPPKISPKTKLKTDKSALGLTGLPTWTDIGLSLVGLFVYLILASILVGLFSNFPWFNVEESQDLGYSKLIFGAVNRIVAMLALVVAAPIAEEIIFRGFLYEKLKSAFPKTKSKKQKELPAIIVSSLIVSVIFGAMHGQWNVGVNVFAMSLVLCGLREITGTIYAGIIMHAIKNAIAFYLVYIIGFSR